MTARLGARAGMSRAMAARLGAAPARLGATTARLGAIAGTQLRQGEKRAAEGCYRLQPTEAGESGVP